MMVMFSTRFFLGVSSQSLMLPSRPCQTLHIDRLPVSTLPRQFSIQCTRYHMVIAVALRRTASFMYDESHDAVDCVQYLT